MAPQSSNGSTEKAQKVHCEVGMSLDGFIAGPNGRPGNSLGDGGVRIHHWMFQLKTFRERLSIPGDGGQTGPDDDLVRESFERTGAYVIGRRMFDEGEVGWPPNPPFRAPVFVVTHRAREPWVRLGGTTFTFVTDGVARALELARAAARDKDVKVSGGANLIRQALELGAIDEMLIHVAPLMLGRGVRLFEEGTHDAGWETVSASSSPTIAHLRYRVKR